MLALFVENDLPVILAERVQQHLGQCEKCRTYSEELETSQSAIRTHLKPSFQASVTAELLTAVRKTVLSRIDDAPRTFGWAWRLERALVLSFRKHAYAYAGLSILLVLSASTLAQIQHPVTMARPDGYRSWVLVGSMLNEGSVHKVYISPPAYQEFAKNGRFPEGTMMVLEGVRSGGNEITALQVSVKDSNRYEGGWGYFDFGDKSMTRAGLNGGCRSCHEERAKTDHVFTQFYPVLGTVGAVYDRAIFPESAKYARS
jgi:hypothetical protein